MVIDPDVIFAEKLSTPLALKGHEVALVTLTMVTALANLFF